MSSKRRGLGMGLSALLAGPGEIAGDTAALAAQAMPIDFLMPSPLQPRRHFTEEALEALAQSIRSEGILQPLLVRPTRPGAAAAYEIIAGERRWRAAQRAGLHEVPVIAREMSDGQALELALVENLQRQDLTALEEAQALHRLIDEFGHSHEALAKAVGRSRSHIANTIRLLSLPPPVRAMLDDGSLTAGHARALLGLADAERLALQIVVKGLNVRQAEALARQAGAKGRKPRSVDPNLSMIERDLAGKWGLRVSLRQSGQGGTLTLRYSRADQLENILRRLA